MSKYRVVSVWDPIHNQEVSDLVADRMNRLREIRRVSERGSYVGTSEVLWLLDEIEQLTKERDEYAKDADVLMASVDRLRAALEGYARDSLNPDFSLRLMRESIERLLRGGR